MGQCHLEGGVKRRGMSRVIMWVRLWRESRRHWISIPPLRDVGAQGDCILLNMLHADTYKRLFCNFLWSQ